MDVISTITGLIPANWKLSACLLELKIYRSSVLKLILRELNMMESWQLRRQTRWKPGQEGKIRWPVAKWRSQGRERNGGERRCKFKETRKKDGKVSGGSIIRHRNDDDEIIQATQVDLGKNQIDEMRCPIWYQWWDTLLLHNDLAQQPKFHAHLDPTVLASGAEIHSEYANILCWNHLFSSFDFPKNFYWDQLHHWLRMMGLFEDHSTLATCFDFLEPQAHVHFVQLSPKIFAILANLLDFLVSKWKEEIVRLRAKLVETGGMDSSNTSRNITHSNEDKDSLSITLKFATRRKNFYFVKDEEISVNPVRESGESSDRVERESNKIK